MMTESEAKKEPPPALGEPTDQAPVPTDEATQPDARGLPVAPMADPGLSRTASAWAASMSEAMAKSEPAELEAKVAKLERENR